MQTRALVIVVVALAVVAGASSTARARPKAPAAVSVDAELVTMHATRAKPTDRGGHKDIAVDPLVNQFPALAKAPYAAYKHFKVLRRGGAILATGMAWKTTLPNKRDVLISLKGMAASSTADAPRYAIVASMARAGSNSFAPVLETEVAAGDTVFIPGEKFGGGLLVVSLRLVPPAAPPPPPAKAPPPSLNQWVDSQRAAWSALPWAVR